MCVKPGLAAWFLSRMSVGKSPDLRKPQSALPGRRAVMETAGSRSGGGAQHCPSAMALTVPLRAMTPVRSHLLGCLGSGSFLRLLRPPVPRAK